MLPDQVSIMSPAVQMRRGLAVRNDDDVIELLTRVRVAIVLHPCDLCNAVELSAEGEGLSIWEVVVGVEGFCHRGTVRSGTDECEERRLWTQFLLSRILYFISAPFKRYEIIFFYIISKA